jgi:hypothetical protein
MNLVFSGFRMAACLILSIFCVGIFQGPLSKNPLAFKWYNAEEEILGKKMKVCSVFYRAFLLCYISCVFQLDHQLD